MMETHIYRLLQKNEIGLRAAGTTGNRAESASLPKHRSVFTAETRAIHLVLNTIYATTAKNYSIFTG